MRMTGVLVVPFRGLKTLFWYLLGCLASKVSQQELGFAVPFRMLS